MRFSSCAMMAATSSIALLSGTSAAPSPLSAFKLDKLPDTGKEWTTMKDSKVEFQPAANLSPLAERHLRQLTSASSLRQMFADGAETYYDEYAQAWRALGFYTDCDYVMDNNQGGNVGGCQRFLLWAAYVDEGYSGNGPSEYKFYDRHSNRWDTSGCKDGERCVAMDCHLPDSHFSLLAFFKEPQYDEFFEQLLQYQGDCLWTDDEYNFMQAYSSARNLLPITAQQGCIGTYLMDGQDYIYYNLKPAEYGELGIGIYTDADCIVEYKGTNLTPQTLLQKVICDGASYQNAEGDNGNGDDDEADALYQQICATSTTTAWSLSSDLNTWNDAFDVFKQCQPCMTFDLTSVVAGLGYKKNSKGDRYTAIQNLNGGQEVFTCQSVQQNSYEDLDDQAAAEQDDDQFQPINQCMQFRETTQMLTATWKDVELAGAQDTITSIRLTTSSSTLIGKGLLEKQSDISALTMGWLLLLISVTLFVFSLYRLKSIKDDVDAELEEPLVPTKNSVSA